MLETGVVGRIGELRIDVGDVRNLGVIERQQHVGHDHLGNVVVGRHHHVVAGVAAAQLGEQLIVAGVEIVADRDPGRVGEILDGRFTDVGVPVVDVHLLALAEPEPTECRHGGGDGDRAGHKAPAARGPSRRADRVVTGHGKPLSLWRGSRQLTTRCDLLEGHHADGPGRVNEMPGRAAPVSLRPFCGIAATPDAERWIVWATPT